MNHRRTALIALTLLATGSVVRADPPSVGTAAPAFKLQDQAGRWHELKDYRGKWVTLYFYPKDQTPSSTDQACEFRDTISAFRDLDAVVLGVSVDDVDSHKKFSDKNNLPFPILADPTKATATRYDVLKSYPGAGELAKRDTFLIDPEGRVVKHYPNVDSKGHSQTLLEDIKRMQTQGG